MRDIYNNDSIAMSSSGGTQTFHINAPVNRIDLHALVTFTGTTDCTIDGDFSLLECIDNVKINGMDGVICDLESEDLKAIAVMGKGTTPQDYVLKTGALTGKAKLFIPIVVNQFVKSVQVKYNGNFATSGKILTASGGLAVNGATLRCASVDLPNGLPLSYEFVEKALSSGMVSEPKSGITKPVKALAILPSADIITKLKITKDGSGNLLDLEAYDHFVDMIAWENDIETFLSEKYYGSGSTLEAYQRHQKPAGLGFLVFDPNKPLNCKQLKFDITASTTGTARILIIY